MTIKPEVLAAMGKLRSLSKRDGVSEANRECVEIIRAELLAMNARLAEADALLLRYCVQVGELTKGLDPHDPIFFDLQRLGSDYVSYHERGHAMHNSAREVAKSAPVDQIRYDNLHISALILSTSTVNKLISGGVVYVSDLCGKSAIDLLKMDRFGKKSLGQIERALAINGMRLRNWDEPEYKVTP